MEHYALVNCDDRLFRPNSNFKMTSSITLMTSCITLIIITLIIYYSDDIIYYSDIYLKVQSWKYCQKNLNKQFPPLKKSLPHIYTSS